MKMPLPVYEESAIIQDVFPSLTPAKGSLAVFSIIDRQLTDVPQVTPLR